MKYPIFLHKAFLCFHIRAFKYIYYDMRLSKCFSVSFTYIGAVIGAGFATGREVMLYFGKSGLVSALAGGVLMGLLAGVFLYSARSFKRLSKSTSKIAKAICVSIKICLYISTYATFLCMLSGCEEIISQSYDIANVGIWTGLFVSFLGILDMGVMRKFNLAIVPVIILLLLVLASKSNSPDAGSFLLFPVITYAAMNVMTGGYLLVEQEEEFNWKECLFVGVLTAAAFAAAVGFVYSVSHEYKNFSMPIYEFSKLYDLKGVSGAIIYLAIFTTLIGCAKLLCQSNESVKIPKAVSVTMLVVTTFIGVRLDFGKSVGFVYPIIGYVGVVYLCFMLILPTAYAIADHIRKQKSQTVALTANVSSDAEDRVVAIGGYRDEQTAKADKSSVFNRKKYLRELKRYFAYRKTKFNSGAKTISKRGEDKTLQGENSSEVNNSAT